jgi:hypothetical protein
MNQLWQQEAMRLGGQSLVEVLTEMRDNQRTLIEEVAQLETTTAKLMSGFPADDVDGHRRYHESVIEWRELRNKMVREALVNVAKAGTLGALGWLALAIWKAFQISVTR